MSGAIPLDGRLRLRQLSAELAHTDDRRAPDWLRLSRLIFQEMEQWLDYAPTVTHLQNSDVATMVMAAIDHRQRRRDWQMLEYEKGSRFWQREWFDHWSRSDEEDERISRYIRNNPVRAGLVADFEQWQRGSW